MSSERVDASMRECFEKCQNWKLPEYDDVEHKVCDAAAQEASHAAVFCRNAGITQSMHLTCTSHVIDALSRFQLIYSDFMASCSPFIDKIEQIGQLEDQYRRVDEEVDQQIRDEEVTLKATAGYDEACEDLREASLRYKRIRQLEGNRDVVMRPMWMYVLLLMLVATGEVMINYNFMLEFMDIPAFAFASAAAVGGVVAWASHEHGRALKQFTFYFGSHVRPEEKKHVGWQFAVASLFLAVVFVAIYYVRYIAVVNSEVNMLREIGANILNSAKQTSTGMGPNASALTSLGSNAAVWGISIWISTIFHDRNPHYMEAAQQKKNAEGRLKKITRIRDANVKALNSSRAVKREQARNEIKALTEDLGEHLSLYKQVQAKRDKIISHLVNDANRYIVLYKQTLVDLLLGNGDVKIYGDNNEIMSTEDYERMNVSVDENYISQLIRW